MVPPPPSRPRRWPWVFAWLLLTVYFAPPPRDIVDPSLDKSNYATYTHFFARHAQWGTDVVSMTGPFGFILYGHTYTGELFWLRLFADLLLKAAVSVLLLHLFRRAGPGFLRWIWLIGFAVLVQATDDLFHDGAILFAVLGLLAHFGDRDRGWSRFSAVLLGVLALFKGTQLVTTALGFGAVVLLALLERKPRELLHTAGWYLGAILGGWLLARQNPLHLPAYLRSALDLSSGYNAVMGLDEPNFIFIAGLELAAGLALILGWVAFQGRRSRPTAVALLLLAGFSFIKWKHGFLRADGHVAIFFASAGLVALTAPLAGFTALLGPAPDSRPLRRRPVGLAFAGAVAAFAFFAAAAFSPRHAVWMLGQLPAQLQGDLRYLVHPGAVHASLEQALAHERVIADTPGIRAAIGRESVDFFGYEEGVLLLNHLNYHPRPMGGGSFNVFTPRLQLANERFVRDPATAPAWEVLKLQTLDDRLPAADDPLTLRAILDLYRPVLMQRDYLLLERSPGAAPGPLQIGETRPIRPAETLALPDPGPGRILLFSLHAPLSFAGRLRSFFYRPPELTVRLVSDDYPAGHTFALKPTMLQNPVILSPLLLDTADVIKLLGGRPGDRVHSLRLDAAPGFATDAFSITFSTAPRPPTAPNAGELLTYLKHPRYNRPPVSLVTEQTGIHELYGEPLTLVHAPGSITWNLRPGDRQVIFDYGLMPQAYLDGGITDGVEFNVEILWPPADGRILFKRMMRPLTIPHDRGMQHARIFLPPFEPGAQLRIRTHPGPDNNGADDQSYVTHVQIESGPLDPGQFNGLGAIPVGRKMPHEADAGIDGRPVWLIHAPNEVALNLPAGAREFRCEIGLLPAAYTPPGNSDGVDYTLFVQPPGGERRQIWTRFLDPLHQPSDRGPQYIAVPLPALPAGTHLIMATDIGPHHDRSWDQSYIAGVRFQ